MTFSSATTSAERAPAAEQRHLAKSKPWADGGHAPPLLAGLGGNLDLHAHAAPRQDEEQLRLVALADDDLSLLENERVHDGLHQPVFLGIEALEHIELGECEFRLCV